MQRPGWVKKSCRKFMPLLYKVLNDIPIHSARERYSKVIKHPQEWKKKLLIED